MKMHVVKAASDPNLFANYLGSPLETWSNWFVFLRCLYGLKLKTKAERDLVRKCTGRDPDLLPKRGFRKCLALVGRKSGKSKIAGLFGAAEAVLGGHESKLSAGETALLPIVSPSRSQSKLVKDYVRAALDAPLLRQKLVREVRDGFGLSNGITVSILTADWRTCRGPTLVGLCLDEICFHNADSDSKVKSDTELVRALTPGLATTGGKLLAISSPYARRGWAFRTWERCWGNDAADVLVWNCASTVMNPTLPQSEVDSAMAEDLASAKAEYLAEWRDDCGLLIPREVVENLVIPGRKELLPNEDVRYAAAVDMSGGRGDAAALAIGHREGKKVIVDLLRSWPSPHDPQVVASEMVAILREYRIKLATGDHYAATWVSQSFESRGIRYQSSEMNKSEHYLNLLPRLCSGEIELLDDPKLVDQLANLERRTRSGGRDIVDHPAGGHDDSANVIALVCDGVIKKKITVGAPW